LIVIARFYIQKSKIVNQKSEISMEQIPAFRYKSSSRWQHFNVFARASVGRFAST
jgi:hypothetical protein